jgi:hypothetical protein
MVFLQAYDSHCNLVLGDVEETIYVVEEDENEEETIRVRLPIMAYRLVIAFNHHGHELTRRSPTDNKEARGDAFCTR